MKSQWRVFTLAAVLILLAASGCVRHMSAVNVIPPTPLPALPPLPRSAGSFLTTPTSSSAATLRSWAQKKGILIGAAVHPTFFKDPGYTELLKREFNAVTPEVAMKFDYIHPERDRYDFTKADEIVDFALANGMVVRGHTLVWDQQLPTWITEGEFSRDEWLKILEDHIKTIVGQYKGKVTYWDVVNEVFDAEGQLRDTIWLRNIGPEYIPYAFRWAREADPDARLFLNENGGEGLNRKSQAVYTLVQALKAGGVPVDGVGLQMHVSLDSAPSKEELAANIKRLSDLGLEVQITEMDVKTQYSQKSEPEKLAAEAKVYSDAMSACLQSLNCTAFVTWGLTDRYSWIPPYTGQPDYPLLFDDQGKPKPAYYAVLDVLMNKTH